MSRLCQRGSCSPTTGRQSHSSSPATGRRSSWSDPPSTTDRAQRRWPRRWRRASPSSTMTAVDAETAATRRPTRWRARSRTSTRSSPRPGDPRRSSATPPAPPSLYKPPFLVDQSRPRPPADLPKQLAELISAGRRGDAVELYQTKYVGIPEDVVAQLRHAPFRPALEAIAHTLLYDATIIGDLTLSTDLVAKVATPTLVIDGENSMPMLRNAARVLADTLPNGRPCTLAGQSHDISQRQPRQCCWTSSPANHCALRTSSQRSHRSGRASCVSDKIQSRVNPPSLSNSMKRIRLARHSSVGQS